MLLALYVIILRAWFIFFLCALLSFKLFSNLYTLSNNSLFVFFCWSNIHKLRSSVYSNIFPQFYLCIKLVCKFQFLYLIQYLLTFLRLISLLFLSWNLPLFICFCDLCISFLLRCNLWHLVSANRKVLTSAIFVFLQSISLQTLHVCISIYCTSQC